MKKVRMKNGCFNYMGKEISILSGEFHYWRTPRDCWSEIVKSIKELGFNAVSTYIPWDYHELERGKYDFQGVTYPTKDLDGWIKLCEQNDLWIIVKPGPYIYAEWYQGGPPTYACQYCRLDKNFLSFSQDWIMNVCKIIVPHLATNGGKIIAVQVCNEMVWPELENKELNRNAFSWKEQVENLYRKWTEDKYRSVDNLNQNYSTDYNSFEEISLPRLNSKQGGAILNVSQYITDNSSLRKYLDVIEFGKWYVLQYILKIRDMYKKYGITVPLYTNLVPWCWPQDWKLLDDSLDFVSLDHYFHNLLPGDTYVIMTKLHRLLRASVRYPFVLELQSGVWEGWQEKLGLVGAKHFEFVSLCTLAHGIKGINYIMLVGRDNWYFTPIDERGRKRPELSESAKLVTALFKRLNMHNLEYETDVGILWYRPHFEYFLLTGERHQHDSMDFEAVKNTELQDDNPEFWKLYKTLVLNDVSFNLNLIHDAKLPRYLIIAGYDYFKKEDQRILLQYLEKGGTLISFCPLSCFEESGLEKFLPIKTYVSVNKSSVRFAQQDISIDSGRVTTFKIDSMNKRAYTDLVLYQNNIVGYGKKIGRGNLWVLGFMPAGRYLNKLLEIFGVNDPVNSVTKDIHTYLHNYPTKDRILFVINNGYENKMATITFGGKFTFSQGLDLVSNKTIDIDKEMDLFIKAKSVRVIKIK